MNIDLRSRRLLAPFFGGALCFAAGSVIATEFPGENGAMVYSGRLTDSAGNPRTTTESIGVTLFSAEVGGQSLCAASLPAVDLGATQGRFSVPLPELCVDAIAEAGDAWAQVKVGSTTLPRQKLGAVPFAVVAREAQSADFATNAATASQAQSAQTAALATAVAANGVSSAALQAGVVDTTKLANGAVGMDQLDASVTGELDDLANRLDDLDSALSVNQGVLTLPNQPFVDWQFEVTLTSNYAKIGSGVEFVDRAGELDPTTGTFTASRSGIYLLSGMVVTNNIDDQCGFALAFKQNNAYIGGFGGNILMYQSLPAGLDNLGTTVSRMYLLNAGDTVHIEGRRSGDCSVASVMLAGTLQMAFLH
jgi:hypothetical protein